MISVSLNPWRTDDDAIDYCRETNRIIYQRPHIQSLILD